MSLSTTNLIFTSNSIHILPDNALVGTQGPTEATHQTSSIKVTANTNNLHAPIAGTSSYMIISASQAPTRIQDLEDGVSSIEHNAILYWTSYNCNHISRIKVTGNS